MAIKLTIDGIIVEVDTPAQAAELIRLQSASGASRDGAQTGKSDISRAQAQKVMAKLSPGARRLVDALTRNAVPVEALAPQLDLSDARGVGPMIRACNTRSQELLRLDMVISEKRPEGGSTLKLDPAFAGALGK